MLIDTANQVLSTTRSRHESTDDLAGLVRGRERRRPKLDADDRSRIVEAIPMVKALARRVSGRWKGASFDELESVGYFALVSALSRFDPQANQSFSCFAYKRVQGAMIDALRALSSPRGAFRESMCTGGEDEVIAKLARSATTQRLSALMGSLPPRGRHVIQRIYFDGATLQAIASELGLSKRTVRRSHEEAKRKLFRALCAGERPSQENPAVGCGT